MKIELIVTDWHRNGKSIYNTEEGFNLSVGDLHSGTSFPVEVAGLPTCVENEISRAAFGHAFLVVTLYPKKRIP